MRAFIAIDIPDAIRAFLRQKQAAFRAAMADASWVRPEGIHLTLKFLGEISEAKVKEVTGALKTLGHFDPFSIGVRGFGFFPDARRPRVFWIGVEAPPDLGRLAERVDEAMSNIGFAREGRAFQPHLTLARFRTPRPQPAIETLLSRQGTDELLSFEVAEFFLFESKLSPEGAKYRKVERFP